uniref:Glutamic acid-rich protein-like n=1 Tax=Nicotiana tabacum TaxID=4097 RepID=A0A1S4CDS0_TOBAC|nr:PREDICTED: glutamic acid-rich protein-like [Nicotiana tabacum]
MISYITSLKFIYDLLYLNHKRSMAMEDVPNETASGSVSSADEVESQEGDEETPEEETDNEEAMKNDDKDESEKDSAEEETDEEQTTEDDDEDESEKDNAEEKTDEEQTTEDDDGDKSEKDGAEEVEVMDEQEFAARNTNNVQAGKNEENLHDDPPASVKLRYNLKTIQDETGYFPGRVTVRCRIDML